MYDYMKALEDRFAPPPMNGEPRQELEAKRQAVSALLDKQGRKKLLRLVDAHTAAQEEMALNSFILPFRYIYADSQKKLTAKLRQNIDIYQGVDLTEQSRMTLAEWFELWLGQIPATLRPSTLENYRNDMKNHVTPYLGQKQLTQITASDLRKRYGTLGKTRRMHPRPAKAEEQLDAFMDAIRSDPVWHDFFYTELTTGLRP